MADEPSMDEILANLERLLHEGDSSNDEVEEMPHLSSVDSQAGQDHPNADKTGEPAPQFFSADDKDVLSSSNKDENPEPNTGVNLDNLEAWEAINGEEHEALPMFSPEVDSQSKSKRFVLTDAMVINDMQQPLPLEMGEMNPGGTNQEEDIFGPPSLETGEMNPGGTNQEEDIFGPPSLETEEINPGAMNQEEDIFGPPSDMAQTPAMSGETFQWNEQDFMGLIDQVTDDVCSAIAAQLPGLIHQALKDRLSGIVDSKVLNKDFDSGLEEE